MTGPRRAVPRVPAAGQRRRGITAVVTVALALAGLPAAADPGPGLARVAHVAQALAAVRGLGPTGRDALDRALYAAARTQCRAEAAPPAAACLITAAHAACAADPERARCEVAADVVLANLRGAAALVDETTRFRLVRASSDYHAALAAELHRRYAALAAELVLGGGANAGDDAAAIDALCARRDRALHACQPGDAACVPSLPWSRCVAALVWFVGGGR